MLKAQESVYLTESCATVTGPYNYDNDYDTLGNEDDFAKMIEEGDTNLNDRYIFIRVSDLIKKFEK